MTPDIGNALFELAGVYFAACNVRALVRDRSITGVYWPATAFWTLWGMWNLYFYPAVGAWFSFAAGAVLVAVNATWVVLAAWYLGERNAGSR